MFFPVMSFLVCQVPYVLLFWKAHGFSFYISLLTFIVFDVQHSAFQISYFPSSELENFPQDCILRVPETRNFNICLFFLWTSQGSKLLFTQMIELQLHATNSESFARVSIQRQAVRSQQIPRMGAYRSYTVTSDDASCTFGHTNSFQAA